MLSCWGEKNSVGETQGHPSSQEEAGPKRLSGCCSTPPLAKRSHLGCEPRKTFLWNVNCSMEFQFPHPLMAFFYKHASFYKPCESQWLDSCYLYLVVHAPESVVIPPQLMSGVLYLGACELCHKSVPVHGLVSMADWHGDFIAAGP